MPPLWPLHPPAISSCTNDYAGTIHRDATHHLIWLAVYTDEAAEFITCRDLCDQTFSQHRAVMSLAAAFHDLPLEAGVQSRSVMVQAQLLHHDRPGRPGKCSVQSR